MADVPLLTDCEMAACARLALQQFDTDSVGSVIEIEHRGRKTRWAIKGRKEMEAAVRYWDDRCACSGADPIAASRYRVGVARKVGR